MNIYLQKENYFFNSGKFQLPPNLFHFDEQRINIFNRKRIEISFSLMIAKALCNQIFDVFPKVMFGDVCLVVYFLSALRNIPFK